MCEESILPWLFFCIDQAIIDGWYAMLDFFKLLGGVQ